MADAELLEANSAAESAEEDHGDELDNASEEANKASESLASAEASASVSQSQLDTLKDQVDAAEEKKKAATDAFNETQINKYLEAKGEVPIENFDSNNIGDTSTPEGKAADDLAKDYKKFIDEKVKAEGGTEEAKRKALDPDTKRMLTALAIVSALGLVGVGILEAVAKQMSGCYQITVDPSAGKTSDQRVKCPGVNSSNCACKTGQESGPARLCAYAKCSTSPTNVVRYQWKTYTVGDVLAKMGQWVGKEVKQGAGIISGITGAVSGIVNTLKKWLPLIIGIFVAIIAIFGLIWVWKNFVGGGKSGGSKVVEVVKTAAPKVTPKAVPKTAKKLFLPFI